MNISVYTIAKNEEQFVKRWYESCKDADHIFILDTGSTDNTVKIAEELGIEVKTQVVFPWRFDIARNVALSFVPKDIDYCIALDMDEVLVDGWREELEKVDLSVTRPRYEYTWSWNQDGTPNLVYGGDKIHSRKKYVWKHPVHEVVICQDEEIQEWCGLKIHHFPDHTKSRGQYFPLLELSVKEDPEDDRNSYYLAREYFFNNMQDKARDEFKRHLSLKKSIWRPERSSSMRYLAKCDLQNKERWLLSAAAECPERREPWVELSLYYYKKNNWESCLSSAIKAIEIKEKPLEYLCEDFAWGYLPYDLAAISCYNLELYKRAIDYGEISLSLSPQDERLASNLEWYNKKGDKR
jgi:glycosyltransferase involved in cell wall biosynthesis